MLLKGIKLNMRLSTFLSATLFLMGSFNTQAGGKPEDIQQLRDLLQPITSLSAQFEQQITDANGFSMQSSSGLFQVAEPNNLRWVVVEPLPQQLISDGVTLWMYDPDLEQVIVQPSNADIESTPAILFSGDLERLDSAYFIEQTSDGVFELTPEHSGSLFSGLRIVFSGAAPESIALTDALGQVTDIRFTRLELNPDLAADLFVFEIPAGIDVIRND
jgi:outer membrane lipoprotein carrier protein